MKCGNCKHYHHEWCSRVHDSPDPDLERFCDGYEAATNADRIRQMSDEELAEWVKLMVCKYRSCGNCPMNDWCTPDRGIAEWLKQEVTD